MLRKHWFVGVGSRCNHVVACLGALLPHALSGRTASAGLATFWFAPWRLADWSTVLACLGSRGVPHVLGLHSACCGRRRCWRLLARACAALCRALSSRMDEFRISCSGHVYLDMLGKTIHPIRMRTRGSAHFRHKSSDGRAVLRPLWTSPHGRDLWHAPLLAAVLGSAVDAYLLAPPPRHACKPRMFRGALSSGLGPHWRRNGSI